MSTAGTQHPDRTYLKRAAPQVYAASRRARGLEASGPAPPAGDPAQAGDTLIMPNSVNVRADYPDAHNDFDARTALRCTLAAGDKVRLSSDPIAVPGGAFWVPLHSGDLLEY